MTPFQRKLYNVFMNDVVRIKAVPNPLKAFAVCCKIWNHPDVLYNFLKKREADLDLELEDADNESRPNKEIAVKGSKKKVVPKTAKEMNKDGKKIPAIEVSPNQSKKLTVPENTDAQEKPLPTEILCNDQQKTAAGSKTDFNGSSDKSLYQYTSYNCDGNYYGQYSNLYSQNQYQNEPFESNYTSQNQNNYWENGSGFYDYASEQDPYAQVDQSYAGMIPKATETFDHSKYAYDGKNSSEIVDLDTKEIKTVETSINSLDLQDLKQFAPKNLPDSIEKPSTTAEKEITKSKEDGIPYDWAVELMKGYTPDLLENSPKMVIFFRLLEESLELGDRILVFSQSLLTLNLIERFLQKNKVPGYDYNWAKNSSYFRLDGSTTAIEREKLVNEFNANPQIHLFLVSTRAGSLGINLVGANRVIVFDASWNPCHDTQAVCRVYRYGQKKPCFVYRIVMDNCLEKKIYDRQVNKQGMSDRVVDECNPDAHLSLKEVTNLCYDNEEDTDIKDFSDCKDKYLDVVMRKVVEIHSDILSKEPFHHESLLVDRKEKKLSQAEKRLAQRGYEMEKRAAAKPAYIYHPAGTQYRVMRTPDGSLVHRPVASVRPMQAETSDRLLVTRPGGVRPTRWIPAEVWQRQGMTAQEMTLPLDVVIPTSSGEKANIVLKAGQKVMVLKSPKGIYMQLESGKIIAIRTSFKMSQSKEKLEDSDSFSKVEEHIKAQNQKSEISAELLPRGKQASLFDTKHKQQDHVPEVFKANSQSRGTHNLVSQFKSFSVQHLIDNKTGGNSRQPKDLTTNDDVIMIQDGTAEGHKTSNSHSKNPFHRNSFGYNQSSRHQSLYNNSNSPMANVKPQLHESKTWDQTKNKPQTITIDDDGESTAREKPLFKPNLVERKSKHSSAKNIQQNSKQSPVPIVSNKTKQNLPRNSPENPRQMQNVKQSKEHFDKKFSSESKSCSRLKSGSIGMKSEAKQKMPNIKNIPAPYPSACASQGQQGSHPVTNLQNSNYPQANQSSSSASKDINPETSSAENLNISRKPSQKQSEGITQVSLESKDGQVNPVRSDSSVSLLAQESNQAEKPQAEDMLSYDQSNAQYGVPQSDQSFNYMSSEPNNYPPYTNMYGSTNSHQYYPQHYSNSQQGYPYGPYHNLYEPAVYGSPPSNNNPNYAAHISSASPGQSGQYSYSNYPPHPPPPLAPTDQYSPYYNYPPYPAPTNQWQQQ